MRRDQLVGPEALLWDAFAEGAEVDLRVGEAGEDDPGGGNAWGHERTVRGEVIVALLLGVQGEHGPSAGVRIRGARVVGGVGLSGVSFGAVLQCDDCYFEDGVTMPEATARTVRFRRSRLPVLNGARLRMDGLLDLAGSAIGLLRLDHARLDSKVRLVNATVGTDPGRSAMVAEGVTVGGNLECSGLTVRGLVDLRGARVGGAFRMNDARITGHAPDAAFVADNLAAEGRVELENAVADGGVRMHNARAASLHLRGARMVNPGGIAFGGGGITAEGGVWLSDGFSAEGEVRLVGARLGANLTLHGAVLDHPGGPALNLERISAGDVQAAELTVRSGHVGFGRCQVAGSLDLSRSRLEGGDGPVLRLDNAAIGSLVLRALRASGEIIVRTARIEGRVLLERAEIRNPGGIALRMSRTEVGADVFCHGMTVEGTLKLARAVVGRHLDLEDAHLTAPGDVAVDARGLTAGQLSLLPGGPIQGTVVLRHARIGVLRDDPARWPERAALGGMTYDALEPALAARDRLRWLTRDPDGFQPQTYEQLAAHYVATGRHADGRVVMLARERHQRRTETALGRTWGLLQDVTTGYGYQPWRAVLWLVVLLAAGTVVYGNSPPRPLKPGEAPHFNAFAYTLDLLLPIVDLGQERALNPAGAHQWFAYALVAAGWVLATTIAAGAARVIGRRG